MLGTDRPGCGAVEHAGTAGIPVFELPLSAFPDRPSWDAAFADKIASYEPDLVILAGFMRVLGADTVNRFRMVNTHPSLLPSFPGAHGVRDALAYGVKVTGVTVHWVDEGLDAGPIIAQTAVPVLDDDDEDTLRARVQDAEKPLFINTIATLCKQYQ